MSSSRAFFASLLILSGSLLAAETRKPLPAPGADKASIRLEKEPSEAELPDLARIGLEDALKAALSAVPGKLLHAELEVINGGLIYTVGIVNKAHHLIEVEVDAGNGRILAIDAGQDE
jgi:uncharacterized membrane protein YkoI